MRESRLLSWLDFFVLFPSFPVYYFKKGSRTVSYKKCVPVDVCWAGASPSENGRDALGAGDLVVAANVRAGADLPIVPPLCAEV